MPDLFSENIPCQCFPFKTQPCECPTEERALRAYSHHFAPIRAMTHEQREWCLFEIDQVEGYDRKEHEKAPDYLLASTVLDAWADYCRDKGLL